MLIFLIGMPGSGKSTIGRYLAEILDLPVHDLDKLIEQETGLSIPEIFSQNGEAAFRNLEKQALHKVIKEQDRAIISTGGGVPCFFDNLERMQAAGKTVYIDAPLATLMARTTKPGKRPLLADNPQEKIAALWAERQPVYEKADYHISTKGRDSHAVAEEIATLFTGL